MRKLVLVLLILSTAFTGIQAQHLEAVSRPEPLVVINDTETDLRHLVLNPGNIEKLQILKDSSAINSYGDKARSGVIIIFLKPNTSLNKLDAVLDRFNITGDDRNRRVCVDKILLKDPAKILVDTSEVSAVEITTDRVMNYPFDEYTGEKYINIITRKPADKR